MDAPTTRQRPPLGKAGTVQDHHPHGEVGPQRNAGVRQETAGNPRCPAGCDVEYAVPNRELRRQLKREGRRPVDGVVAVHADDCPLNTGPRFGQATMAAVNRGKRGGWT
jgi:hypothetical protein